MGIHGAFRERIARRQINSAHFNRIAKWKWEIETACVGMHYSMSTNGIKKLFIHLWTYLLKGHLVCLFCAVVEGVLCCACGRPLERAPGFQAGGVDVRGHRAPHYPSRCTRQGTPGSSIPASPAPGGAAVSARALADQSQRRHTASVKRWWLYVRWESRVPGSAG